jgi:PKD repeat protein
LSVNATTGVISGTPSAAGSTTVTLTATNAGGSDTKTLTITIASAVQAPVINSPTTASGTVGTAFSYTIAGTNTPTSFSATPLPPGLSVNATTGVISGTPSAAGNFTTTLNATNSGGTGNATLTISIASAPVAPSITSNGTVNGTRGISFQYQITANQSVSNYSLTGNLIAGLSLNSTSGLISGTPTGFGNTTVTLRASNSAGNGTKVLTISIANVVPAINITGNYSRTQGLPSAPYQITATNTPTRYSYVGTLPAGLAFNSINGTISGTPTVSGNFTIGLVARNSAGNSTQQSLEIQIAPAPTPVIESFGASGNQTFESYNTLTMPQLQVNANNPGGNPIRYQWRFNGTAIPGATNATYSPGVASAARVGNYSVVLTNAGNQSVISPNIPFVLKAAAVVAVRNGNQTIAQGDNLVFPNNTSVTFSANVTDTPPGSNLVYRWLRNGTAFPNATSTNNTSVTFSANATTAGSYRLEVTSRIGTTTIGAVLSPEWTVSLSETPGITESGNLTATVGTPFNFLPTTGNIPATSFTVNGTLPRGLTWNATTGRISGTPGVAGTFPIRLTPRNNIGSGAPTLFNLVVANPPVPVIQALTVNSNATATTAGAYNTLAGPDFAVQANNPGSNHPYQGAHPLRYQWRLNGVAIAGATNATYSVGTSAAAKTGIYDVLVTNAVGNSTASRQVAFSLLPAASFTIGGPINQPLAAGANATFSVGDLSLPPGNPTASYQWFRNGVAIGNATAASYTANSPGSYSVQVTTKIGATEIGKAMSATWSVAPLDNQAGILVYRLTGNATRTIGANETIGAITGYVVVDRINNNAAIIQTYGTGFARRNSLETRDDIAVASTGPVNGSRTVLAGSLNSGNDPVDHDLVWLTGRDVENTVAAATTAPAVQPAIKIFAPASLSGILGVLVRDVSSVEIDSFTVTLTLDNALTANAYRYTQNLQQAIDSTRAAAAAAGFINE